jgi:ferrochelatase
MITAPVKIKGALLLNLGTPDAPHPKEVRRYLKEFLMDPLVLDIPYLARWLLVHGAILPKRPITSAAAYRKVWTEAGSPLLFHLLELTHQVQACLGENWVVKSAMRYGQPGIQKALEEFRTEGIDTITLLPLYPQYSLAATESSIREVRRLVEKFTPDTSLEILDPFYRHDAFIRSFVKVIRASLAGYAYDHLLFSFHGLPERQIRKTDPTGAHCFATASCCDHLTEANANCYRAQCYESARLMARALDIPPDRYTVCFQSRLGRTPWIKPYTDELYRELPKKGVKRLAVACPAFVADCLETLEEVQIRGREEFIQNGGEELKLVPSLNSNDHWGQSVAELFERSRGPRA